jgi:lipid-A-disaccharide synthase
LYFTLLQFISLKVKMPPSVMFVAGDVSGDEHASAVIRRLSIVLPGVRTFGIGGPHMAEVGFEQLMPFGPFNRMGLIEIVRHLPFFLRAKSYLIKVLAERRPSALVCVDYPGFNVPLMKAAKKLGVPVVWYIVPQVWAWKKKRAEILGRHASFIGVVFPFEVPYFSPYPSPVSFVGHPLVETLEKSDFAARLRRSGFAQAGAPPSGLDKKGPIRLAVVPGSREQEIVRMLRPMMDACGLLKQKYPGLSVTVSQCRGLPPELFLRSCGRFESLYPGTMSLSNAPLVNVLSESDLAVVTSGTATLQAALLGIPMVIVYRTSALTYSLLKRMVTLPYIGLPNVIAGEKIVPELIQNEVAPQTIAATVSAFVDSAELYGRTREKCGALREKLGTKTPSVEIANAICSLVR